MALESRLDLKLTQKLALTPQLQLQLKLLQLPQLELSQYIQQELTENPFLELEEDINSEQENETLLEENQEPVAIDRLDKIMVEEYFSERADDGRDLGYFNPGFEEKPTFDFFYSTTVDLWEHLLWQLRLSKADDEIRAVAEVVIGNIDEDGYLRATEQEIADLTGANLEIVNKAIELVQDFEPAGVCSRNIKECLILQLRSLGLEDSFVKTIVEFHLEDIQKKKYDKIAKKYNVSIEEVINAVKILEKLEPRPGRNFSRLEVSAPSPDVYVRKEGEDFQIILNDEGIPRIKLSSIYKELFKSKNLPLEERQFLKNKFRCAIDLLKGLDQRNRTIYRVTESLIKMQREFFEKGIRYIKPLNLKAIADDLGLHESTISRVTSNKFIACDHGIFSFRFFFSNALPSKQGVISTTLVKEKILKIIEEEDIAFPLSDKEISERLAKEGIDIARRTVAKYREELKIPPKALRRSKKI